MKPQNNKTEITINNTTKKKINWLIKLEKMDLNEIIKQAIDVFYLIEKGTEEALGGEF